MHSLPLYHSAQMHVFLLPYLAVGAENTILDAPDRGAIFDLVDAEGGRQPVRAADRLDRAGEPPRTSPPGPERTAQGVLRRVDHAGPGSGELRARLPDLAFYNCFGQSEIGPLATVLGPTSTRAGGLLRAAGAVRRGAGRRRVRPGRARRDPGRGRLPLTAVVRGLLGQAGGDRGGVPGGWFHSGDLASATRRATSPSSTG